MIATLRQRDFSLAWVGGLVSMIGDWVMSIALPMYVYQLTGSALATSGMFVARLLPALILGSVAGVFVDRWDRKRTMVVANLLLAAALPPLLVVRSADWVWVVYIVGAAQSVIGQFFQPAENALLPRLVDDAHLVTANSLNALNNNLARLLGPALGGSVMGTFGLSAVVLIDAVSFLFAAAMVALIATSGHVERTSVTATTATARSWRRLQREWQDGIAVIRHNRAVAILVGLRSISYLGEGVMGVIFVVWVSDVLGGGPREVGWFMSAQAVGGLAGGLVLGYAGARLSTVQLLGVGSIIFGLLDLALFNYPRVFSGVWIGLVLIMLVGLPTIGFGAAFATLLQRTVRDNHRGRVFGLMGTISALLMLAGTVIAGILGDAVGPTALLTIQGGSYVLLGVLALALLPAALATTQVGQSSQAAESGARVRAP